MTILVSGSRLKCSENTWNSRKNTKMGSSAIATSKR